jgi:hypothetical protein
VEEATTGSLAAPKPRAGRGPSVVDWGGAPPHPGACALYCPSRAIYGPELSAGLWPFAWPHSDALKALPRPDRLSFHITPHIGRYFVLWGTWPYRTGLMRYSPECVEG